MYGVEGVSGFDDPLHATEAHQRHVGGDRRLRVGDDHDVASVC